MKRDRIAEVLGEAPPQGLTGAEVVKASEIRQSTVYVTLGRMIDDGLVVSRRIVDEVGDRRYFSLTVNGRAVLGLPPFGFTEEMVHAVRSMAYHSSGRSYCPVCRTHDGSWTMVDPPNCGTCGFIPMGKGEYRELAMDAADGIETLLPKKP